MAIAVFTIVTIVAIGLSSCGDQQPRQESTTEDEMAAAAQPVDLSTPELPCPISLDYSAMASFREMSPTFFTPPGPTPEELETFIDQPAYELLLATSERTILNRKTLRNAFGRLSDLPIELDRRGRLPERHGAMRDNLLYLRLRDDALWPMLEEYARPGNPHGPCEIEQLLDGYLPAGLPAERIELIFLAMGPEIRCHEGQVLMDAGVALAARPAQFNRAIASVIYRDLRPAPEPGPAESQGGEALGGAFAMLCHNGIAAWIEGFRDTILDHRHPLLGQSRPYVESAFRTTGNILKLSQGYLERMLDSPASLEQGGAMIHEIMRSDQRYTVCGYSMAAMIEARLGLARLKACAGAPGHFLAAYQEAALDTDSGADPELAHLPAFEGEIFDALMRVMAAEGYPAD